MIDYQVFLLGIPCILDEWDEFTDFFPVVETFIVVVALGNTFPLSLIT